MNNTVPGSRDHKNFSNPLFQDDRCYIDSYNTFVTKHQKEWIKFNREQISIKHDKLNKDILNLKMMVGLKYADVDNIMLNIKDKLNKRLKDEFTNAHKKVLNIVNKKYEFRTNGRTNNSSINKKNANNNNKNNETYINIQHSDNKNKNTNKTNSETILNTNANTNTNNNSYNIIVIIVITDLGT